MGRAHVSGGPTGSVRGSPHAPNPVGGLVPDSHPFGSGWFEEGGLGPSPDTLLETGAEASGGAPVSRGACLASKYAWNKSAPSFETFSNVARQLCGKGCYYDDQWIVATWERLREVRDKRPPGAEEDVNSAAERLLPSLVWKKEKKEGAVKRLWIKPGVDPPRWREDLLPMTVDVSTVVAALNERLEEHPYRWSSSPQTLIDSLHVLVSHFHTDWVLPLNNELMSRISTNGEKIRGYTFDGMEAAMLKDLRNELQFKNVSREQCQP